MKPSTLQQKHILRLSHFHTSTVSEVQPKYNYSESGNIFSIASLNKGTKPLCPCHSLGVAVIADPHDLILEPATAMAPKKTERRTRVTNLNDLKSQIIVKKPVAARKEALEGL